MVISERWSVSQPRNIGGVTVWSNASNNFILRNIPPSSAIRLGLNLNEFQNVNSLEEAWNYFTE
jgi:hypothetical protein